MHMIDNMSNLTYFHYIPNFSALDNDILSDLKITDLNDAWSGTY